MSSDRPLASLLTPDRVLVRVEAESKQDLIRALVGALAGTPGVRDQEALLDDVEAREAKMSTGVGQGIALPHARTAAVDRTVLAFATLAGPIDYAALDGRPVRLALLLAGPDDQRRDHVRLLSRISRILSDAAVRDRLLDARTADDVLDEFRLAEARLA